jgi:tRNA dimethylallyltransferase
LIRVLVIAGPTGVGKSSVALDLAQRLGAEIVGADSVQVFRGMDIGSAKPTREERARVPHHLIDVAEPDASFSAGRYATLAAEAVEAIAARGRPVLIVGGGGLYIRALLGGIATGAESDPEIRRRIAERLAQEGVEGVQKRLAEADPEAAGRIHRNDAYRLARALEVFELTGRPLSEIQSDHGWRSRRYAPVWIGLTEERPSLYARIEQRCERMIAQGLLEEVRRLRDAGFSLDLRPMRALGYRQMGDVLRGEKTLEEALAHMKRATRRYAKRQLTWFRANGEIAWYAPSRERGAILDRARRALEREGAPHMLDRAC